MAKSNNKQIPELNRSTSEKWSIDKIKDANSLSNFKKINENITSLIWVVNSGVIIYAVFLLLARKNHMEFPDISNIAIKCVKSPICAFNAILLIALEIGHDNYYKRTERMLILSDYMILQVLDFIIKLSLLFVSFLQCANVNLFVGICFYGYILTFARALYLKKRLNKEHPLWKEVQEKWFPNNIKHNLVMVFWVFLYYVMLCEKNIYKFICYINEIHVDFQNQEVKKILTVINYSYIIIFDIYWIIRVFNKKITQKNKSFKAQYEMDLEEKVEKYYNGETD